MLLLTRMLLAVATSVALGLGAACVLDPTPSVFFGVALFGALVTLSVRPEDAR